MDEFGFITEAEANILQAEAEEEERERITAIRRGQSPTPDAQAADELTGWMVRTMTDVSTGKEGIDDMNDDYSERYRALRAVLNRLKIDHPNPHGDLWTFYRYWSEHLGSYADRRVYVRELYEPVRTALDQLEYERLVQPVSDRPTGWREIDQMVDRLRADYSVAVDPTACKAIGLQAVTLLQALGRRAFDPERHLPEGSEEKVSPDDAKRRIGYFVAAVTQGRGSTGANIRKMADATVQLAEAIKHSPNPDRIEVGIAADAAIEVVNLVRRVSQLEQL